MSEEMKPNGISDAEIAGIMGWRGPGAYTEASLRKIRQVLVQVQSMQGERALPPLPWGDDFEAWLEPRRQKDVAQAFYDYARAALSQSAASVPAGWKLVPIEPTSEMVRAMKEAWWSGKSAHVMKTTDTYRLHAAMLAAAPASATVTQPAKHPLGKQRWSKEAEMMEGWLNAAQPADKTPAADGQGGAA